MAKRRKQIIAGRLVSELAYTVAYPHDPEHVRQEKRKISTKARQRQNMKAACKALELLIAANFSAQDLVLTLTYRDADLPDSRKAATDHLRRFFRDLRAHRRARGQELKYIYVTESRHEKGRLHHHVVINSTGADLDVIKSLWRWGDNIEMKNVDTWQYRALAEYLAKEPKEAGTRNGKRMWTPSKNLQRPIQKCDWIDDRVTLEPPPGATVLESCSERNEFGEFVYLKYLLPEIKPRPCRSSRRRQPHKDFPIFSDLEPCIYNGQGGENARGGSGQEENWRV